MPPHQCRYIVSTSPYLQRVHLLQVLGAGALKPLAEHMNGQQFTWLQGLVSGKSAEARAAEAAALAGFLAGCSQQGFKYGPAYYGCLVPYMPVCT